MNPQQQFPWSPKSQSTPQPSAQPIPQPAPQPAPVPQPAPAPMPTPVSQPVPQLVIPPTPTQPTPIPAPQPTPIPAPQPMQQPAPQPMPTPMPMPAPIPQPQPMPQPVPMSQPTPQPYQVPGTMPTAQPAPAPPVQSMAAPPSRGPQGPQPVTMYQAPPPSPYQPVPYAATPRNPSIPVAPVNQNITPYPTAPAAQPVISSGGGARPVVTPPAPDSNGYPIAPNYSAADLASAKGKASKKPRTKRKKHIIPITIALLVAAAVGYILWFNLAPASGPLAPDDPIQAAVGDHVEIFERAGATITPVATYDITAKILSIRNYEQQEYGDIMPFDLALGWGDMSNPDYTRRISIGQNNRFYTWTIMGDPVGLDRTYIEQHSANTHIIPATQEIHNTIRFLRRGNTIRMTGYLVNVVRDKRYWETSLTRKDTGAGACEIMWVTAIQVFN